MTRRPLCLAALLVVVVSCGNGSGRIEVSDAWSRPVPPVAPASAIYMNIDNGLDHNVTLVGATSDACETLAIHETSIANDGVMSMEPVPAGVDVGAVLSVNLEPGGVHLMCGQPSASDTFDVTLEFDETAPVTVTIAVEDR